MGMERFDIGEVQGAGVVSQVFDTGDFLIWSEAHGRAFMCFLAELDSSEDPHAQEGEPVYFRMLDGKVTVTSFKGRDDEAHGTKEPHGSGERKARYA